MLKILAVSAICAIVIIYLKSLQNDLYYLSCIVSGVIVLGLTLDYLAESFSFINNLIEMTGVDKEFFKIIFKTVGIGYLFEFSSQQCEMRG